MSYVVYKCYLCDMNRNRLFCPSSLKIQNKRIVLFLLNVEKFLKGTHFVVNMKIYLLSNKENIFNKRLTTFYVNMKIYLFVIFIYLKAENGQ